MQDFLSERILAGKLLEKVLKINTQTWGILEKALSKNTNYDLAFRKEIKQKLKQSVSSEVIQSMIYSSQFKQSTFLRNFVLKTATDRNDIKSIFSYECSLIKKMVRCFLNFLASRHFTMIYLEWIRLKDKGLSNSFSNKLNFRFTKRQQ